MSHPNPNHPSVLRQKIAEATGKAKPEALPPPPKILYGDEARQAVAEGNPKRDPPPMIAHRCGHERPLHDVVNADCPACRDQKRQAKARKKREADDRRRSAQQAAGAPVLGKAEKDGRLPDGSRFSVRYEAVRVMWVGVLELTDGPCSRYFEGEASSVEYLLRELARKYRESVTPQPETGA